MARLLESGPSGIQLTGRYARMEVSDEPCPRTCLYRTRSRGDVQRRRFDARHHRVKRRIVDELVLGGNVAKEREGRRNGYNIQVDSPLGEDLGRDHTIGELLKAGWITARQEAVLEADLIGLGERPPSRGRWMPGDGGLRPLVRPGTLELSPGLLWIQHRPNDDNVTDHRTIDEFLMQQVGAMSGPGPPLRGLIADITVFIEELGHSIEGCSEYVYE